MSGTTVPTRAAEPLADDEIGAGRIRGRFSLGTAVWMTGVLLLLIALFSVITPGHAFFQLSNFQSMGRDAAIGILLAVAMTFILGSGHLDLSIGANLVFSSVLGGKTIAGLTVAGWEILPAVLVGAAVCIVVGAGVGAINGLIIARAGVNSFITTLATTGIATGVVLVIAGGADVPGIPSDLQLKFGVVNVIGIPVTILVIAPIVAVLWLVMRRTRFGIKTVAIGSDLESAVRAGIDARRHTLNLFIMSGTLAGVSGFLDITKFGSTNILGHNTDALAAIAAAVIGGTSLFGGRASIGGSITGALIPVVLGTGLVIARLPYYLQQAAVGVILLIAVFVDSRRRKST